MAENVSTQYICNTKLIDGVKFRSGDTSGYDSVLRHLQIVFVVVTVFGGKNELILFVLRSRQNLLFGNGPLT